ncbi:MAG: methylmalonyl-CoA mutase family protein [Pseudomonadota bacterium]
MTPKKPDAPQDLEVRLSRTRTLSGTETDAWYGPGQGDGLHYERDLGDPGQYPYTRGAYAQMYRSRMWSLRAICGYGAPEDTREALQMASSQGLKQLSVVVDPLTQQGIDPDHPAFGPEIGRDGASVPTARDADRLLEGIDLSQTDVAWHSGPIAYPLVAAVARRRGMDLRQLQGSHMPDLLHQNVAGWGERVLPVDFANRITVDSIEYVVKHSPRWALGMPQAYDLRERGLTPAGEIAVGMAIVMATLEGLSARGMGIDDVAPSLAWVSVSDIDFFEEIAKFRALRRFWARTMKERFGAQDPRSMRLRIACHTSGRSLVYKQPLNNLSRVAIQTVAALLGGVQSLDCCTFDEPIGIPTHEARELAIRTQQIVAHEVGVARTADPLGGSWYIESLTDRIEQDARQHLAKIEEIGLLRAFREGYVERMADEQNLVVERELDRGERVVIGLNRFVPEEEPAPRRFQFDMRRTHEHVQRLVDLKRTRDNTLVAEHLRRVFRAARAGENAHPAWIDALGVDATLGEIWGTLRMASGLPFDAYNTVQAPFSLD